MHLIYGKRVAKIKTFTDNSNNCTSCKAFDLRVKVFREYYHLFFIPFVAFGDKRADIRCNQCTEPIRTEALKKEHEKNTRTPFYMYSLAILVVGLIASLVIVSITTQIQTRTYVVNPKAGDVYLIYNQKDILATYSFLRVAKVNGDTIVAYHNNLRYLNSVDKFSEEDYFVNDEEMYFTKAELKQMFEKDELTVAKRNYGNEEGFNRVHIR